MVTVIVGTQWGDEGKGRISHFETPNASMIIRATGGSNAGHTVVSEEEKYALHLLPSSIINPNKLSIIGPGVAVDAEILLKELEDLWKRGIRYSPESLIISPHALVVLSIHRKLDEIEEEMRGSRKIGTTKRGIGPAYEDRKARIGIRVWDLLGSFENLHQELSLIVKFHNPDFSAAGYHEYTETEVYAMCEKGIEYGKKLYPYVKNTIPIVYKAIKNGEKVVLEGAQSTFLDNVLGNYPDVTASHCTASGTCDGAGVGPTTVENVIGVMKAYCSRVGVGPFPTEQINPVGDLIRELGHEYGTTTGRPRRCGWLDLVMIKYANQINDLTCLALNHMDTIGKFDEFKVCVGYDYKGKEIDTVPVDHENCRPIYKTFKGGWKTEGATTLEDLGPDAVTFVKFIEDYVGVPVKYIGIGPDAKQTIVR